MGAIALASACTVHTHPVRYVPAPVQPAYAPEPTWTHYEPSDPYARSWRHAEPRYRPVHEPRVQCRKTHEVGKGVFKVEIRKCRQVRP